MDVPRFHLTNTLHVIMILLTCSVSAQSEDIVREDVAVRLKQALTDRLENERLVERIVQRQENIPVEIFGVRNNPVIVNQVHHIDHLVYGTSVIYGQQIIDNQLKNKIQQLSSEYELTETQQSKLLVAGQYEAKKFSNEVDALRQKYDSTAGDNVGQQIVVKQARTLQKKRGMLFGHGSFSSKVMTRTVTGEQLAKYQAALDDRLRLRHRSNIEGAIRDLERQVVIKIAQQEMLVELLMSEIPPPKLVNDYDETVVKYQFSRIPEEKIQPIFDEGQWPQVRQTLDGFGELETVLIQQGVIDEEGAEPSRPASFTQQTTPTDATPINRNRPQQEGKEP